MYEKKGFFEANVKVSLMLIHVSSFLQRILFQKKNESSNFFDQNNVVDHASSFIHSIKNANHFFFVEIFS